MTEALYMTDSYIKEFEAEVQEVKNGKEAILSRTAFYPSSGGQPTYTGTMVSGGREFIVTQCKKENELIIHSLNDEGLFPGMKVKGMIDWQRRYMLMRMHTAAHLLSQVLYKDTGAMITGNQLDVDKSRIDFALAQYDPDKFREYIAEANRIIAQDLPISISFMPREDVLKNPSLSRLAKGIPVSFPTLRIVAIGDFDVQTDGGTHVKSTKEIGNIALLKMENKGKNNRRLYFSLP